VGAFAFAYNALVTGVNFIANLPAELKALGQIILGAIEKVLSAVEEAVQWLAKALNVLLSIVIAIAKALLTIAFQPITNLVDSYVAGVYNAIFNAAQTVSGGGAVTQAETEAFWQAFANPLVLLSLSITVAIIIVLAIIDALSLGTAFLLGAVVSVLVSLVSLSTSSLTPKESGIPHLPLPQDASHIINNMANNTISSTPSTGAPKCSGCPTPISPSTLWQTLGELFVVTWDAASVVIVLSEDSDVLLGLFGLGSSASLWATLESEPEIADMLLTTAGIVLTIALVAVEAINAKYSEPYLGALAFWIGAISDIVDGWAFAVSIYNDLEPFEVLDGVLFGVDLATTAYAGYELQVQNT
jgi:uncharacterized membrane protein YagU involved in acid resistance